MVFFNSLFILDRLEKSKMQASRGNRDYSPKPSPRTGLIGDAEQMMFKRNKQAQYKSSLDQQQQYQQQHQEYQQEVEAHTMHTEPSYSGLLVGEGEVGDTT